MPPKELNTLKGKLKSLDLAHTLLLRLYQMAAINVESAFAFTRLAA